MILKLILLLVIFIKNEFLLKIKQGIVLLIE